MQRQLDQASRQFDKRMKAMEQSADHSMGHISHSLESMGHDFERLVATLALEQLAEEAAHLSDEWTNAGNQLRSMGVIGGATGDKLREIADLAVETHASFEETVDLYAKLRRANEQLQFSDRQRLGLIQTINEALVVGGATTQQKQSVLLDLSEAIGIGNLGGRQLRNLRQNSQILSQAIEKEFKTVDLSELSEKGELSITRVLNAFINSSKDVASQFGSTITPIDAALQNLKTRLIEFVGAEQEATGANVKFVDQINFVANNVNAFGHAALVAGQALLTAFSARSAVLGVTFLAAEVATATNGFTALSASGLRATQTVKGLSAAVAAFGGPEALGAAILAAGFIVLSDRLSDSTIKAQAADKIQKQLGTTGEELKRVTTELATAEGEHAKALERTQSLLEHRLQTQNPNTRGGAQDGRSRACRG